MSIRTIVKCDSCGAEHEAEAYGGLADGWAGLTIKIDTQPYDENKRPSFCGQLCPRCLDGALANYSNGGWGWAARLVSGELSGKRNPSDAV
jgi:hypothetical protein